MPFSSNRVTVFVVAVAWTFGLLQPAVSMESPPKAPPKTTANKDEKPKGAPPVDMDAKGYRHWAAFEKTPIKYDYVVGLYRGGQLSFYLACVQRPGEETGLIAGSINGQKLGATKVLFSSKLIDDVYDPADPKKKAPFVQMARTSIYYDEKAGYACMTSIFPGEYGKSALVPALFSSPTSEPGTWKYHGKLKGEPGAYEEKMRKDKKHWYGEGSVVRVGDDRWRVYVCGYGVTMAAAESASLDGPWKFVKNGQGSMKNVADAALTGMAKGKGACFPYALKVSDKEYHVWISEGWPCRAVWHLSSENGLDFKLYGKQPEICPTAAAGCDAMKGVRAFLGPDGKTIQGWIPFMPADSTNPSGWVIYQSTMPAGLQPQAGAAAVSEGP